MSNGISSLANTALQQALFQYADKNKDGSLNQAELTSVAPNILGTPNPGSSDIANLLKQLDTSKDGKVSEQEFLQTSVAAASNQLSSDTLSALLGGDSTNPYSALTGYNSGASAANLYSSLINSSLGGTYDSTGALTGALVAGSLAAKNLLV